MKKKSLYRVFFLLFLAFYSCANKKQPQPEPTAEEKPAVQPEVLEVLKNSPARQELAKKLKNPQLRLIAIEPFTVKYKDVELKDLKGKTVKLSSFEGNVIMLNFWATWCGPCRAEMPAMEKLYQALKTKGFVLLAVDLKEDQKTVAAFIQKNEYTFPVLIDKTETAARIYTTGSIPITYLIDRKGYLVAGTIGAIQWDQPEYMEIFELLLGEYS